jgi:hypothetical protein
MCLVFPFSFSSRDHTVEDDTQTSIEEEEEEK